MGKTQTIMNDLRQRKQTLRCAEVKAKLEELGFDVRDGARGGHKIVSHPGLKEFMGTNFDCGHGTNPTVKAGYITKLLGVLRNYETELDAL